MKDSDALATDFSEAAVALKEKLEDLDYGVGPFVGAVLVTQGEGDEMQAHVLHLAPKPATLGNEELEAMLTVVGAIGIALATEQRERSGKAVPGKGDKLNGGSGLILPPGLGG